MKAPLRLLRDVGVGASARSGDLAVRRAPSPAASPPFFGRDRELAQVARLCDGDARLVTLVGPPGAGKTRLAREHVQRAGSAPIVELGGARTLGELVEALRRVVPGAQPSPEPDLDALLHALRAAGPMWIVLDDFDGLVPECAADIGAWIDASDVRFIVTSREALWIDAEQRVEVGPLGVDDALALYVQRAADLAGVHGPIDPVAARALVEQLDRLPLSIELGAARADVLDAATLSRRLANGLMTLRSRRRDVPARRTSLVAALEVSWELLEEDERRLLACSSVFRGGLDLDLIERMGFAGGADALGRLLDRSLVRRVPESEPPRFDLYESIRQFAREKLALTGEAAAIEARHAEVVLARAEAFLAVVRRNAAAPERVRLELERGNLAEIARRDSPADVARAVLILAALPSAGGAWQHHVELIDRALAAIGTMDARASMELWLARGELRRVLGPATAADDFERALGHARTLGDDSAQVRALGVLGQAHRRSGRPDAALSAAREAVALATTSGDPELEADARLSLGAHLTFTGEAPEARAMLDEALRLARRIGDRRIEARALHVSGVRALSTGALAEGTERLEESWALYRVLGETRTEAVVVRDLGTARMLAGEGVRADELFAASERMHTELRADLSVAITRFARGVAALRRHDDAAARTHLGLAIPVAQRTGDASLESLLYTAMAWLHARADRPEAAREALARAKQLVRPDGDPRHVQALELWTALVTIAEAKRGGDLEAARAHAREKLSCARLTSDEVVVAADALREMLGEGRARACVRAARDASYVQIDDAPRMDLRRRGPARRILAALLTKRLDAPGVPLDATALVAAGWPGDRSSHDALLTRLYTIVRELRRLGLADLIVTVGEGYVIDAASTVTIDDA
jgi:predicted ATPase